MLSDITSHATDHYPTQTNHGMELVVPSVVIGFVPVIIMRGVPAVGIFPRVREPLIQMGPKCRAVQAVLCQAFRPSRGSDFVGFAVFERDCFVVIVVRCQRGAVPADVHAYPATSVEHPVTSEMGRLYEHGRVDGRLPLMAGVHEITRGHFEQEFLLVFSCGPLARLFSVIVRQPGSCSR